MRELTFWWMAFRPKTLSASVVPIMVATTLIFAFHQEVRWGIILCALMGALFIQIGTNLLNDAIDFKKGADGEGRIGPQRVSQYGLIKPERVMIGGWVSFVLATLCGIPLVWSGGWVIVAIGILSLICGYAYTGGPFPLAYKGFGDLFVILFFGVVAVGGVYYLQAGTYETPALIAGLQVGLLATVLIAINNLRDHKSDALVDKRTLAVRFGVRFARVEIATMVLLPYLLNILWLYSGYLWVSLLPLISLPLALRLIRRIFVNEPSLLYNHFLGEASRLHLIFGSLLSIGFLIS